LLRQQVSARHWVTVKRCFGEARRVPFVEMPFILPEISFPNLGFAAYSARFPEI
jgi:hypothetical protein